MKLLYEKCEIYLGNEFLSSHVIRDALGKKFNISVVDERPNYIKFRIIRFARLYGFPFIWPQATIEVWIENENDKLGYGFFWPEYLALIIPFILFLVIEERLGDFLAFFCTNIFRFADVSRYEMGFKESSQGV